MVAGVVITVGGDRIENLRMCLASLEELEPRKPEYAVVVLDGPVDGFQKDEWEAVRRPGGKQVPVHIVEAPKHEPGMEQPRNIGVRKIQELNRHNGMLRQGYPVTHAWFLDSDIIVSPSALASYEAAMEDLDVERVMVGPYDWLPEGVREQLPEIQNDIRWASFNSIPPTEALVNDLSAGLACLGGNLVWPIDQFARIGGFWSELHHGRCEDGELGLRAVACGTPISYVVGARGWHLHHPENMPLKLERNERDVPMLNERHPWVQGAGLFVVEEDGKRFNVQCPCGWQGNTAEIWDHKGKCEEEGWGAV